MTPYTPDAGRLVRPEPVRAAVLEGRIRPLSRPLALALLARCTEPGMRRIEALVVPDAPGNLDALLDRWPGEGTPVPVSGEHATGTIWGHPDLNALYRAWHDTLHVLLVAPFGDASEASLTGEMVVGAAELRSMPAAVRPIMAAEGMGQARYFERWGRFPRLQRAFVVYAVRFGLVAAIDAGDPPAE